MTMSHEDMQTIALTDRATAMVLEHTDDIDDVLGKFGHTTSPVIIHPFDLAILVMAASYGQARAMDDRRKLFDGLN